jgi:integration host factor subunit alpha
LANDHRSFLFFFASRCIQLAPVDVRTSTGQFRAIHEQLGTTAQSRSCPLAKIVTFHLIHPVFDMTITKAELTREIVDAVDLTQREAKDMVDAFFAEITACLIRGEEVKLAGFGVFETRDKVERPGRNPATGEVVVVTPRRVVAFRPSRDLRLAAGSKKPAERIRKVG